MNDIGISLIFLLILFSFVGWVVLFSRIKDILKQLQSMEALLKQISNKKQEKAPITEHALKSGVQLPTSACTVPELKDEIRSKESLAPSFQMPPLPPSVKRVTTYEPPPPPPSVLIETAVDIESSSPSSVASEPSKKVNYEEFIGGNLFGKIGIFVLVVGIGLFVKYAIDNEWINEVSRTILGFVTGSGLLLIAGRLRKKYRTFSSLLAGGAFAVFYVTVAVAYHYYQLFLQPVAFVILVVLTVFMTVLSILYDRRELAVIALIGGYIAPFLTSSGEGNYIVLFSYIAILNLGMFGLSIFKKWAELPMISFFATYLIMFIFIVSSNIANHTIALNLLLFATLFYMIFLLPLLSILRNDSRWIWINRLLLMMVVLNNFVYMGFALFFVDSMNISLNINGLFPIGIAVVNMAAIFWLKKRKLEYTFLLHTLLGVVLTFISIAIPIQLEGTFITLFWASEMVLLAWLYVKSKVRMYEYFSVTLIFFTLISFIMDIYSYEHLGQNEMMFANKLFATNLFVCLSYLAFSLLIRHYRILLEKSVFLKYTPANGLLLLLSVILGNIVVVWEMSHFSVSLENISLFETSYILFLSIILSRRFPLRRHSWLYFAGMAVVIMLYASVVLSYKPEMSRVVWMMLIMVVAKLVWTSGLYYRNTPARQPESNIFTIFISFLAILTWVLTVYHLLNTLGWHDSQSAGFSIALSVAGFALMTLGMRLHLKSLRIVSLSVFFIVFGKLLIVDVWSMPIAGKIAVFIMLGVILLLLSFLYQKLKNVLFNEKTDDIKNERNE